MPRRPDQDLFEQHSGHFGQIDAQLQEFCSRHGLRLEKNALRSPCRVIRQDGNPNYFLDIFQEGIWHEMSFSPDLPHSVLAAGHHTPPADDDWIYRVENVLACGQQFHSIIRDLSAYLESWLKLVEACTPDAIIAHGIKYENVAKKYRSRSTRS